MRDLTVSLDIKLEPRPRAMQPFNISAYDQLRVDDMIEEEQEKYRTKTILSEKATEGRRMTRSGKKGVTFGETLYFENPGTDEEEFQRLRKQEQSMMLNNLKGNLNVIEEGENEEDGDSESLLNFPTDI